MSGTLLNTGSTFLKNSENLIFYGSKLQWTALMARFLHIGERCDFQKGDRLYIKRIQLSPGPLSTYWEYQIESDDNAIVYKLSEFQHDRKNLIRNWF